MTTLLRLLATRVGLAVLAGAILLAALGVSRWQINGLRADLAEATSESTTLRAEIGAQNAAVRQWRAEAERRAQAAQAATKQAAEYRRQAETNRATLEAYNPQGKGECDALVEIVDLARGWRPIGRVQ